MGEWMSGYLDKLAIVRQQNLDGGGPEQIRQLRNLGKLSARERIEQLIDPDTFEEIGSVVTDSSSPYDGNPRPSPSDGVIMGVGKVNGRLSCVYAFDFTVMSGSIGDQASWKLADLTKMAGQMQIPIIGMIDSAGSRLSFKNGDSGLNGFSTFLKNYSLFSGIIPRITLLLGPCSGLLATVPALSDFLIINAATGFLWLGGKKVSDDAGRADFQMEKSGQCDIIAESDADAIEKAKALLSFIPQNCWEKPACLETGDDPQRKEAALLGIMPDNPMACLSG